jgi:hypothetical protein
MENLWLVVLVGVIAAVAGYFFGMLDSRVTKALKETREEAVDREEAVSKLDEHSVLQVTVDPALKWHLDLDGTRIEPDGLTAEQRARLVNILVQIRPWIDGKTISSPSPREPGPVPTVPPLPTPIAPAPTSALASVGTPPAIPASIDKPRIDLGRGWRTMLENDLGKKPEPLKAPSIVAMIDDVLQKKLANSPLAEKRIRLEEGSVGEVVVFVGLTRYSGVDAVPDEEIKAIIRAAIADWDKK